MSTTLHIDRVSCGYAATTVLEQISFTLAAGQVGCLLGPSGCGKTTLLRAIAGLEPVRHGEIRLGEQLLSAPDYQLAAQQRGIGLVFQDFALFPHLSVADNIAFGLFDQAKNQQRQRVADMLTMVGLEGYAQVMPHQLSGGQQQRVALARALAPRPRLLLLDEPFSSLDVSLRQQLGQEVRRILKTSATTALLVTHDQQEAFILADEVGVMMRGSLLQWAPPYQLYHQPATPQVADFIGEQVWLQGEVQPDGCVLTELGRLCTQSACVTAAAGSAGELVDVLIRPDDVVHQDDAPLRAVVVNKQFRGAEFLYQLQLPSGQLLLALVPSHHDHQLGEAIGIVLAADHVVTFRRS